MNTTKTKSPRRPANRPTIASEIVAALSEFSDSLKHGTLRRRLTRRDVNLSALPRPFSPAMVRKTRGQLRLSQSLFAEFLGVAPQTVRSWEQGVNPPSAMACRFMEEILHSPQHWADRVRQLSGS